MARAGGMIHHLATACRQARLAKDAPQSVVAATLHRLGGPRDQSSIARFERGESWPRDADRYVEAYARAAGITDSRELWATALVLYESVKATDLELEREAERAADDAVAQPRRKRDSSAAKRRARGSR